MRELRERLACGDQAAFAELYDACADRLHHYLVVQLRSREDADDVLQETFVRAVRTRESLASVENLNAWMFTIARNEANRLLGRRQRERELIGEQLFRQGLSDESAMREAADLAAAALARLSPDQREIVELRIYGGLGFREIATVTGLPQGTVATRYRAALDRMKQVYAPELP